MTNWPFPPFPNPLDKGTKVPKFNPDNFEDAPLRKTMKTRNLTALIVSKRWAGASVRLKTRSAKTMH